MLAPVEPHSHLVATIALCGFVDEREAGGLRADMLEAIAAGGDVRGACDEVMTLEPPCVQVLLAAARELRADGRTLQIDGLDADALGPLAGLDRVFGAASAIGQPNDNDVANTEVSS